MSNADSVVDRETRDPQRGRLYCSRSHLLYTASDEGLLDEQPEYNVGRRDASKIVFRHMGSPADFPNTTPLRP